MKTESLKEFVVLDPPPKDERKTKIVIRLRTSYWRDERGLYSRQSVTYLRSKCEGFNLVDDEAQNIGADETFARLNVGAYKDGLYEVAIIPDRPDYETGYSEDWEYALIPLD